MKFLPVILLLAGVGAGFGIGRFAAPSEDACVPTADPADLPDAADCPEPDAPEAVPADDDAAGDFVRMADQFVIPVLDDGALRSLVVLSLTLEVETGATGPVFELEPKLRDAFLRALFDHANTGGFDGNFTEAGRLERLRRALLESARKIAGPIIKDILILDLLRQET